jgi:site-specific DNA recombinase
MGQTILTIMASVGQLERNLINDRTRAGKRATIEQGRFAGGQYAPYGYDLAEDPENPKKRILIPNDAEQKIIEDIRRHRRSGKSYRQVAAWLDSQCIISRSGKPWSGVVVCDILKRQGKVP